MSFFKKINTDKPVVMNAAGIAKTNDGFWRIVDNNLINVLLLGTYTKSPRSAPGGKTYHEGRCFTLNNLGLQNSGPVDENKIKEMIIEAKKKKKQAVGISVAGSDMKEYSDLTEWALALGADFIEYNLSAPGEKNNKLMCFNMSDMYHLFEVLRRTHGGELLSRMSVKMAPYTDASQIPIIADSIFNNFKIGGITLCNAFPNAFAFDESGAKALGSEDGLGSMGGPALKPISLGQIVMYKKYLKNTTAIIGAGGIESELDITEYIRAGADMVQIGSKLYKKK